MRQIEIKQSDSSCRFNENNLRSGLKQKRKLGSFIQQLIFHYKKKSSQIAYTFMIDEALLQMNQQYLQHDTYTDIITFDLTDARSNVVIADIYISLDRVKENALTFGHTYQNELLRVILHGALHVVGFSDKTKAQQQKMRSLEEEWMNKYFIECE